jgi:hypothetical protein
MNREQCNALIERLADKKKSTLDHNTASILGSYQLGLYIGDILNKPEIGICFEEEERKDKVYETYLLWSECGVEKSLQTILEESEWEVHERSDPQYGITAWSEPRISSPAKELFEYLITLFL